MQNQHICVLLSTEHPQEPVCKAIWMKLYSNNVPGVPLKECEGRGGEGGGGGGWEAGERHFLVPLLSFSRILGHKFFISSPIK